MICPHCNEETNILAEYIHSYKKHWECIACREKRLEKNRAYQREYFATRPGKQSEYNRRGRLALLKRDPDYEKNREKRRRQTEPEKIKERSQRYCLKHPEKRLESCKKWADANKDKCLATMKRYQKRRMANDPAFKLHTYLHKLIWADLKGSKNWKSWTEIVGYDSHALKAHLEGQFREGMNWENYGKWHIDHIIPKKAFSVEQVRECWSLNNLQPLWASENCSKGAKMMEAGMMNKK